MPNYFPGADQFMKSLYRLNQLWFESRLDLSDKSLKAITQIRDRTFDDLAKLEFILKENKI